MTWNSGPWDNEDFEEDEWRLLFGQAIGSKLLSVGSISRSASNRNITWTDAPKAVINGALGLMTANETFSVPLPSGSNKRCDYLILKYDPAQVAVADKVKAMLKLGAEALNPSFPELIQTETGVYEMPVYRWGPYGAGPMLQAPADDMRNYRTVVRGALNRDGLFAQGNRTGDIGFTPDNIYRHDGNTWNPYLGDPNPSQMYTASDTGYPRNLQSVASGTVITNQLTVPSAPWRRILRISAMHYLAVHEGANDYDALLLLGNSLAPVRRARHATIDVTSGDASLIATNVSLDTMYNLPANQSLRIRTGFVRVEEANAGNVGISSGSSLFNNINVHATPA
jgi:hypothetical protein